MQDYSLTDDLQKSPPALPPPGVATRRPPCGVQLDNQQPPRISITLLMMLPSRFLPPQYAVLEMEEHAQAW
jgi:hypothetical protein